VERGNSADGFPFCKIRKNKQDCTTSDELVGKAKSIPSGRNFAENKYFLLTLNGLVDRLVRACVEMG
jgi:hypothetical protein